MSRFHKRLDLRFSQIYDIIRGNPNKSSGSVEIQDGDFVAALFAKVRAADQP